MIPERAVRTEKQVPQQVGFGITCGGSLWPDEAVRAVEEAGFDSFWTGEHTVYHRPIMDAIPLLTAAACATRHISIGPATFLLPLRHPTLAAKELCSLDIISGGRLIVGVGVGGDYPKEFACLQVPLSERGRRATEAIQIMRLYWTQDRFSFHGRHFQLEDAWLYPKPVQPNGPPIWVSGRQEPALRRAALYGDGFMPYMYTPEMCREAFAQVRHFAAEGGRTLPDDYVWCLFQYISMSDDLAEARRWAVADQTWRYDQPFDRLVDKYPTLGPAERCAEHLQQYIDAGVNYIILAPICPVGEERRHIERYAERLMPFFAKLRRPRPRHDAAAARRAAERAMVASHPLFRGHGPGQGGG